MDRRLAVGLILVLGACPAQPDASPPDPQPSPPPQDAPPEDAPPPDNAPPIAATPVRSPSEIRAKGNHLVGEPSPYLEQHSHNPVEWYPWGDEALAKAKRDNKPIFLSIGYSTCHWCHVMEKESFEDDEVAAFLNENFVAIKVDREQRPDVDALYIDAVAAMGGRTGWPLTVFLTPDLKPFHGGTYYPRHGSHGRPGFLDVLREVHDSFATDGAAVADKGAKVLAQVEQRALGRVRNRSKLGLQLLDDAMSALAPARDPQYGGFGSSQKFPNAPLLLAELRHTERTGDAGSRAHVVLSLEQMLAGGVRDHLAGTFHRYTVDHRWHLPHFEKMLYDNAQLASLYIEAGLALSREDFVAAGRAVLDDLIATWQQPDGGFVVGFDADDPEGEGAFYSWTPDELDAALGPDGKIVAAAFGVTKLGDREIGGRSVLHRRPDDEVASALGLDAAAVRAAVDRSLPKLAAVRSKRPPPATDDKELVAWNGLAIMALADAGRWLDEPRYTEAAQRSASFVVEHCWKDGTMHRGMRAGKTIGPGFLDDYALAGLGLVRLHAATGELRWLSSAREIADAIRSEFYDPERHTFLLTAAGNDGMPVRLADLEDGVMPSGGSAAVLLALELGAIAGDHELYEIGMDVLERTASAAVTRPFSAGFVLVAVEHATAKVREVVIAGEPESEATIALWKEVAPTTHARILPVRLPAAGAPAEIEASFPALTGKKARGGKPTAYVCEQGSCEAPTDDPNRLAEQLAASQE